MTDKQNILLKASETAAAVDLAKSAVEAAKAALETARADLDEAKAGYDAALDICEEAGIPKSKARKAIEALNRIWIEAGVIDGDLPTEMSATESDKAVRRKRKSKDGDGEVAAVPAEVPAAAEALEAEVLTEAQAEQDVVKVEFAAAPVDVAVTSVEVEEVEGLIVEFLEGGSSFEEEYSAARSFLTALLHGEAWAAETSGASVDAESFRKSLTLDRAEVLAASEGIPAEIAQLLASGLADRDEASRILAWFAAALFAMEDGKVPADPLYAAQEAPAVAAPAVAVESAVEAQESTAAAVSVEAGDEPEAAHDPAVEDDAYDDYVVGDYDSDVADFPDFDESFEEDGHPDDDRSFTIDDVAGVGHGEVLTDIGEINFLDEAVDAAPDQEARVTTPTPTVGVDTENKPKPPRGNFAPPSFLKNK